MAIHVANAKTGDAPSHAKVGDTIKTQGGTYQIVNPGTPGAGYNPSSGFWSVRTDNIVENALKGITNIAESNSAKSQSNADKQMAYQTDSNSKAMAFSADQAQLNRDWQEKMSNTAHQREVKDLMAAGLNPILSAMGGSGATTPSGASASGVSSSGAQGQVDMSALSAITSIVGALINGDTSKAVAEINRDSSITTAQINAKSASNVANINAENQRYIKEHYPSNATEAAFNLSNRVSESLLNMFKGFTSGKNASGKYK